MSTTMMPMNGKTDAMTMPEMSSQQTGMQHTGVFHFSASEQLLFPFWNVTSSLGLFASCVVVVMGVFLLEWIRWLRQNSKNLQQTVFAFSNEKGTTGRRLVTKNLIIDTALHGVQITLSYLTMCLFMTLNLWICFTIVLGEIFAHLVFRFAG